MTPEKLPPSEYLSLHYRVEDEHGTIYYMGYNRAEADAAFDQAIRTCKVTRRIIYKVQIHTHLPPDPKHPK